MARSKENGSLTGSKRYKDEKESNSLGSKAKKLAESAGTALSSAKETLSPVTNTISNVANAVTTASANASNTVMNINPLLSLLKNNNLSHNLKVKTSLYLKLYFLIKTKNCSSNYKIKAP